MSAVYIFDFTLKADDIMYYEVVSNLRKFCKKFTFQLEEGKEEYRHYQGRISLKTKLRLNQMIKVQPWINHAHYTITSAEGAQDVEYVTKEESRIDGPWTEKTNTFIPKHIMNINFRPWQNAVVELCKTYDKRKIYVIIDKCGNIGKSTLCTYIRCHGWGRIIPPLNDAKDIMQMVCCMGESPAYLIDMPRALDKKKLNQMYTAIEIIKSGYAFDTRYTFKELIFNIPAIIVFTNEVPDQKLLSMDRWELLTVVDNNLTNFLDETESL